MSTRLPHIVVVSRVHAIRRDGQVYFQGMDGWYLDGIASECGGMTILAPIHEQESSFARKLPRYSYVFRSENVQIVPIEDGAGRGGIFSLFSKVIRQVRFIRREIERADIVFVFFPTFRAYISAILGKMSGKTVVVYAGNNLRQQVLGGSIGGFGNIRRYPYYWVSKFFERWGMRSADIRLCNGKHLLREYSGYAGQTIQTRPLIPDLRTPTLRGVSWDFAERDISILCVANILHVKGIDILVRAMRELAVLLRGHHRFCCRVVGTIPDDKYVAELRQYIEENKLSDIVFFEGYVSDRERLREYYDAADIFVLPSRSEGFPRVLYEAMSSGLPVLASDLSNITDMLPDGTAYYFSVGNWRECALRIKEIMDGTGREERLSRQYEFMKEITQSNAIHQFCHLTGLRDVV